MKILKHFIGGCKKTKRCEKTSKWKTFNPKAEHFKSKKAYKEYRKLCKCGVCHKKLETGDEFDLRAIQTREEMKKYNDSNYTSFAVIVHRSCVERS